MDEINKNKEGMPTYAGLNKTTADQFITISKWLLSAFILIQFVLISGIYKGEQLIAKAKGEPFQIIDFLTSVSFIAVAVTTAMMLVYVLTRIFWYAILLGLLLCFEVIADFSRELKDGFSYEDLEVFIGLASVNAFGVLCAAFCMYAIKEIDKQK